MKFSLVFPSWCEAFGIFERTAKKASSFPPLNLCIVGALAEQHGWEVQLIDAEVENLSLPQILERLDAFDPDLVGLTATTPFFHRAVETARSIKAHRNRPIIVGGPHISILREKAFEDCFDFLFAGECEPSLGDFLREFARGNHEMDVPGVITRNGGAPKAPGNPLFLDNLDAAPLPARHLLRNDLYFVGTTRGKKQYTSMQMTRGCPYSCVYCASDLYGKKIRQQSLEKSLEELDVIVNQMGIKHVYFMDDTLTIDRKYILALCDAIEARQLRFTFEGSTRANLWDENIARRMKKCGLIRISFGLETVDPHVREIIKKNVPLDAYTVANKINNSLGIETINSVMLGLPGETRESIQGTIDYLCRARELHHANFSIAIPYPGTEMLHMARHGIHGLRLVEEDFAKYQRYGSAVMEVNGMTPAELIELQQEGLRRIYSCWWRIIPMLKRHGVLALVPPALHYLKHRVTGFFKRRSLRVPKKQAAEA